MRPMSETITCEQASRFYYDYVQDTAASSIELDIRSHIEKCKFCQKETQRLRLILAEAAVQAVNTDNMSRKNIKTATVLASHFNLVNREITCEIAKRFIPSLADASLDIRIPTPITAHIENCELCKQDLDTIRKLNLTRDQLTRMERVFVNVLKENHKQCELNKEMINSSAILDFNDNVLPVLKHILNRQESGVTTEYITKRPSNIAASENIDSEHKNWPVEIKVHNKTKEKAAESVSRRIGNYKRLIMPFAAAAAVVLIAVWFFADTSARALKYNDIYSSVSKIQNICLTTGISRDSRASQEVWVSKALNIKLFHSSGNWILWDTENKVRKSETARADHLVIDKLNDVEIANVEQTMDIPRYILPFQSPYSLPEKYNWKSLPDTIADKQLDNVEVYDLLWSDNSADNVSIYYKWRVYIDKDTMLPKRVENWQKQLPDGEYELRSWTDITYPQTPEIEKLVDKAGLTQK